MRSQTRYYLLNLFSSGKDFVLRFNGNGLEDITGCLKFIHLKWIRCFGDFYRTDLNNALDVSGLTENYLDVRIDSEGKGYISKASIPAKIDSCNEKGVVGVVNE